MAIGLHKVEPLSTHRRSDLVVRLAKGGAPKIKTSLLNPRQNRVKFTVADAEAVVVDRHLSTRVDKVDGQGIGNVDARALRTLQP